MQAWPAKVGCTRLPRYVRSTDEKVETPAAGCNPAPVELLRDQHRQECLCYKKCPHESGHSRLESPLHETFGFQRNVETLAAGCNPAQRRHGLRAWSTRPHFASALIPSTGFDSAPQAKKRRDEQRRSLSGTSLAAETPRPRTPGKSRRQPKKAAPQAIVNEWVIWTVSTPQTRAGCNSAPQQTE